MFKGVALDMDNSRWNEILNIEELMGNKVRRKWLYKNGMRDRWKMIVWYNSGSLISSQVELKQPMFLKPWTSSWSDLVLMKKWIG